MACLLVVWKLKDFRLFLDGQKKQVVAAAPTKILSCHFVAFSLQQRSSFFSCLEEETLRLMSLLEIEVLKNFLFSTVWELWREFSGHNLISSNGKLHFQSLLGHESFRNKNDIQVTASKYCLLLIKKDGINFQSTRSHALAFILNPWDILFLSTIK